MAEPDRTTPTSESSWIAWQLMHLSFQIGFLKATANRTLAICEQMLTILMARPEPEPRSSGIVNTYRRARELWEHFERLHKLVTIVRAVRWGTLAWSVLQGLRWLGMHL